MSERLFIQVEPRSSGETLSPQATGDRFIELTTEQLDAIGKKITTIAQTIAGTFTKDKFMPSEFEIEFGIGIGVDGGVPFIAKGSIETNFKVTATWKT